MRIDIGKRSITDLVARQLDSLFFLDDGDREVLARVMPDVLVRIERCFSHATNKYYRRDGEVYFSPWHSGQYTIFLYLLANTLFAADRQANRSLADKVYYLNRALNGLDLYYEVEMPDVFFLDHPLGSVIGRGVFGNFFTFSQQCTVGNNHGIYPVFGERVTMLSGSKVIGKCHIGDDVILAANSYVKDTDIPANSLVFGQSPDLVIKPRR